LGEVLIMAHNLNAQIIGGHERTAYTVEHRGNCVLITGAVPMSAFGTLANLAPPGSVMDPDAARVLGVTFAMGPQDELAELRAAGAANAERHERAKNPGLSEAATRWLGSGERGISSNFIFNQLTGIDSMGGWDTERNCYPYDPSDFRRCQLLLEQVPELQATFGDMALVSDEWARLVKSWPDIIAALDQEAPTWRDGTTGKHAPTAYQLIKKAIGR
jgi:hypothetical protein